MKWLSAGVTFVSFSTVCGLILGMVGGGLNPLIAAASVLFGAAIAAYLIASDGAAFDVLDSPKPEPAGKTAGQSPFGKYRNFWKWGLAACFAIFAFRSFCWLVYIDSDELKIQSPYNLGDLALHITYIRNFANGVFLWPDNPIYVFSKLRYPAGIDLLMPCFVACMSI